MSSLSLQNSHQTNVLKERNLVWYQRHIQRQKSTFRHVFSLWAKCRVKSGLVLVLIFGFSREYSTELTGNEGRERDARRKICNKGPLQRVPTDVLFMVNFYGE